MICNTYVLPVFCFITQLDLRPYPRWMLGVGVALISLPTLGGSACVA
jgi:hypothetical protein